MIYYYKLIFLDLNNLKLNDKINDVPFNKNQNYKFEKCLELIDWYKYAIKIIHYYHKL